MPLKLPAPILHLEAVFRPSLLRPDIKAASVDHVDWNGLRRAGWNAVVIDKDNCLVRSASERGLVLTSRPSRMWTRSGPRLRQDGRTASAPFPDEH